MYTLHSVPRTLQHVMVSIVSNREDVRRHLIPPLALVQVDDFLGVDGQPLVGVDSDAEQARVGL